MASTSPNGSSLRKPGRGTNDEGWKDAPSRETTHDDPDGKDREIEAGRRPLENDPKNHPDADDVPPNRNGVGDGQKRAKP